MKAITIHHLLSPPKRIQPTTVASLKCIQYFPHSHHYFSLICASFFLLRILRTGSSDAFSYGHSSRKPIPISNHEWSFHAASIVFLDRTMISDRFRRLFLDPTICTSFQSDSRSRLRSSSRPWRSLSSAPHLLKSRQLTCRRIWTPWPLRASSVQCCPLLTLHLLPLKLSGLRFEAHADASLEVWCSMLDVIFVVFR